MTRLSGKKIIKQSVPVGVSIPTDFYKPDVDATVRDKGISCIFEKAYLCPCKSKNTDHRVTCKNCGGTGWIFANPKETSFLITGIVADSKLKEAALRDWGMIDSGVVNVTALNDDKFSYMDRVRIKDATAEHGQILYPAFTDDESQLFAYTKYDIIDVDYIALFVEPEQKLQKLEEGTDYTWRDNILLLDAKFNGLSDPCVTIRYIHNPVFHIIDILRESFTSTQGSLNQGRPKIILPIKALAKRAHLIKDVEDFDGDRLLDNSWLPSSCTPEEITGFVRQLRYMKALDVYDNLTDKQKLDMALLFESDESSA